MKKKFAIFLALMVALLSFSSCGKKADEKDLAREQTSQNAVAQKPTYTNANYSELFKDIDGSAVFFDDSEFTVYNQNECETRYSPCSTFKIISTLMGLENGIIESESTALTRNTTNPVTLTLKEAFQKSRVWYFKKITDEAGAEYVRSMLSKLNYGNQDISEWNGSGINPTADLNGFWIESSLQISPIEQVQSLSNIFNENSPFNKENIQTLKTVMKTDTQNVYGKTGSGRNNGWFVGFIEQNDKNIYFAVHLSGTNASGVNAKEIALNIIKNHYM